MGKCVKNFYKFACLVSINEKFSLHLPVFTYSNMGQTVTYLNPRPLCPVVTN